MMASTSILLEIDAAGVARLTLNRPEVGNRYDPPMLAAMIGAINRVAADDSVRCLLLRGVGRHFCVGADIGWHSATSGEAGAANAPGAGFIDALLALDGLGKPTVALLHGGCIGGGVAFAACCDIALAAPDSFFSIPEVRLGLSAASVMPFFVRAMGARALRRYALSGERFDAETALRLGLVHQIATDAAPILDALLLGGPVAQGAIKGLLAREADQPFDAARILAIESGFAESLRAAEPIEGLAAFREKRVPNWYRGRPM